MIGHHVTKLELLAVLLFVGVAASGCGQGTGGSAPATGSGSGTTTPPAPTPTASRTLQGQATKGPLLAGSSVQAFRVSGSSRGALLGSAVIGSSGSFTIPVTSSTYTGTVLLEARGSFVDETTGLTQNTGTTPLRGAAFGLQAGRGLSGIQITALTEIGVALAQARGGFTEANLRQAFSDVGSTFSLASIDATTPAVPVARTGSVTEGARYALVLAGLSGVAFDKGISLSTLIGAADADASDGRFDGTLGGQIISITNSSGQTVFYSPETLTTELARGIERFLASPGNINQVPPTDPTVIAVTGGLSNPNRAPRAFASAAPAVTTTASPVQLDGRGSSDPEGEALIYRWTARLGIQPFAVIGANEPRAIFTANVAGTYDITLTVTDTSGGTASSTIQVVLTERSPLPSAPSLSFGALQSPATVPAGQSFTLTVPVVNSGGTDARPAIVAVDFADSRVSARARASNPAAVPAGQTALYVFDVSTTPLLPAGSISATLRVEATDFVTNAPLRVTRTLTLPVTVQLPPPGPALTLSNLRAPATLQAGQQTSVTVDVTNPSASQRALITDARLEPDGAGIVASLEPESPREVLPGQTVRLSFALVTAADATAGSRPFRVSVFAIDPASGLPLAASTPLAGLLTITAQARLRVTRLTATPSVVSTGTPIDIGVTFVSEGAAAANVSRVGVLVGDQLFLPSPSPAPATLQAGGTLSFDVRLDSSLLPLDRSLSVSPLIESTDAVSGDPVEVVLGVLAPVVIVQTPGALAITGFTPTPRTLSSGQTVRVELTVANRGSGPISGAAAQLTMRQGAADVTSRFTIAPAGTAPATIPGNSSVVYRFDVTMPASGVTGAVTVEGTVTARDQNSGAILSPVSATLSWFLQLAGDLVIGPLTLPRLASLGQTFTATFAVTNRGEATVNIDSASVGFVPATGLVALQRSAVSSIRGGQTATFAFDVSSASSGPPGTRTADIFVTSRDANSGASRTQTVQGAGQITLQIPASVVLVSILGDRPANTGQRDNPVSMLIRNDGQATAIVQSAGITPALTGFNPRLVTPLPFNLAGGQSRVISFLVDVPERTPPGNVQLRGFVVSTDVNTSISQTSRDSGNGFILVQTPAVLRPGDLVLEAPSGVDRGGTAVLVLRVANRASAAGLQLDSFSLRFTIGSSDVSSQYTVTAPADIVSRVITGGTTQPFVFGVAVSPAAVKLSRVTITVAVAAHDINEGTSSNGSAATGWFVRDAADSVIGQTSFSTGGPNQGNDFATARSLNLPFSVATDGARLAISDQGNNRVLLYSGVEDTSAVMVLGQRNFESRGIVPATTESLRAPAGVVFAGDRVIVADRGNNRVLIYNDIVQLYAGKRGADLVLGQESFSEGLANRTTQPAAAAGATTLHSPTDVAVTVNDLVVADTGNNRVLIYRDLFGLTNGAAATVVLGQADFTANRPNRGGGVTLSTMSAPASVAVTMNRLFVADTQNHRVLVWNDFASLTSNTPADLVLGQADGTSSQPDRGTPGANQGGLDTPMGVRAAGTRLLIGDSVNNRLVIYTNQPAITTSGALPDDILGQPTFTDEEPNNTVTGTRDAFSLAFPAQGAPLGSADYFVADVLNSRVLRFPIP